jgi:hypothetical protein
MPVGDYDPDRLSNLGLGHAAIDAGGRLHLPERHDRLGNLRDRRADLKLREP